MKTSLIIATYNWPEALELVLLSVLKQSITPDEVLIADDGSTLETQVLIKLYSSKFQTGIKHVWQEDKGFQKTSILNKSVYGSKGEYIIQIDGDIIMHKHFIRDHIKNAKKNNFIHGSRVFLNEIKTKQSILHSNINFSFFEKGIKNRINCIHSSFLARLLSQKNKTLKGTRGCNFSFWKEDFMKANGYNEDMNSWGKEDTELSVRLMNNGMKKKKIKCLAVCYHLHHTISSRAGLNINNTILNLAINNKIKFCTNGINKYASRN